MKRITIFFLILLFAGCTKQYITQPVQQPVKTDETKVTKTEEISKDKARETDVVSEKILREEKLKTIALPTDKESVKEESRFEFKDVLFDYDRYNIIQDARAALDSTAEWLTKNKNINVVIEGHCDERGTNEYNLALGERRAKSVRDYLSSLGISSGRMSFVTYGEEKPLCTEQNESCWQKNRRAHFVTAK